MSITVLTSVELERREKEKRQQDPLNYKSSLRQKPKFTWQQKEKWPQTNFASFTANAGRPKKGSKQQKHKSSFHRKRRLGKNSCNEKPIPKKGSNKHTLYPSLMMLETHDWHLRAFVIRYPIRRQLCSIWRKPERQNKEIWNDCEG
ncbi:hypothetical protein OSB04_023911 [Centaurea solstitialis]|uniref:Uncharacterized protein n=1 Tax=Centaurea solstitialis TaxID=347529 RepID=A0AA38WBJ9_9ASTR|nr:hypothetical protein OSB04_023911 [Centaurea solstitialis]